ncbi:MAG: 3-oxoacyl-[acyl-carrier-protein] reductase [Eubacteriales bacterium]|nr:3-oxoacyl-[acyl-carrier-protein] reductase [Clostridiales bacterium]MDD7302899.1 3-oxoacyl-[acyl-carrier-protein] reductase [Eubacteriales bacterium]MDY4434681.1 3-oxoacyl-[acyl-carrier-protein] reductase [Candidatus Flemingibacterium sp.]
MLQNKVAVVTGGSRGIGKAIAEKFAAEGASVAILYSSNSASADAVVEEIRNAGGTAKAYQCHVENSDEVGKTIDEVVNDLGKIDILINNAGITRDKLLMMMKEEDFDDVISVNLKGAYNTMRKVCPMLARQRWGRVINLSSIAGINGNAGQVNYSASKAGLIGMTKSAAREFAGRGITVNAIAPGFVETDMTEKFASDENVMKRIPVGRMGRPDEIASLALFLASDAAAYITGEVIRIDGGLAI